MASRDFTAPWQSRAIQDVLQAIFLSELLRPSAELWVLSAWISDVDVLDNSARAFSAIRPDWPVGPVRLSELLKALISRGNRIVAVLREVEHNDPFVRTLKEVQASASCRLGLAVASGAHEKTIVGDDYVLGGSMNLTHSGLGGNDEHVLFRLDRQAAAARRLALRQRWEGSLKWE